MVAMNRQTLWTASVLMTSMWVVAGCGTDATDVADAGAGIVEVADASSAGDGSEVAGDALPAEDADETPVADPCMLIPAACPEGQELELSPDGARGVCIKPFKTCEPGEVPDGNGGCVSLGLSCPLGAADSDGRCQVAVPDCVRPEVAVAGRCVDIEPRLECPPSTQHYADAEPGPNGRKWFVDPAGDASTGVGDEAAPFRFVKNALALAGPNDVILLSEGDHAAFAVQRSSVTIIGVCPGRTRVGLPGQATSVDASSPIPGGRLTDLTFEGIDFRGTEYGFNVGSVDRLRLAHCRARAKTQVVGLYDTREAVIQDVEVLAGPNNTGAAVLVETSSDITLQRVVIAEGDGPALTGLSTYDTSMVVVSDSRITGFQEGVQVLMTNSLVRLERTLVTGARELGLRLQSSAMPVESRFEFIDSQLGVAPAADEARARYGAATFGPFLAVKMVGSVVRGAADTGIRIEELGGLSTENCWFDNALMDVAIVAKPNPALAIDFSLTRFGSPLGGLAALTRVDRIAVDRCIFEPAPGGNPVSSALRANQAAELSISKSVFKVSGIDGVAAFTSTSTNISDCSFEGGLNQLGLAAVEGASPSVEVTRTSHVRGKVGVLFSRLPAGSVSTCVGTEMTGPPNGSAVVLLLESGTEETPVVVDDVAGRDLEGPVLAAVGSTAKASLVRSVRSRGAGVFATVGADLSVRDSVLAFTRRWKTIQDGGSAVDADGLHAELGARVRVLRSTFAHNEQTGASIGDSDEAGSSIDECVFLRNAEAGIVAAFLADEGQLRVTASEFLCNARAGLLMSGAQAALDDNFFQGDRADAAEGATGLIEFLGDVGGSMLTMDGDVLVAAPTDAIVALPVEEPAPGARSLVALRHHVLELVDVEIRGAARSGIDFGGGGELVMTRTAIEGAHVAGILLRGGSATIEDSRIDGTLGFGGDLSFGDGVMATRDASVTCSGSSFGGNYRAGLLMDGGKLTMRGCTLASSPLPVVLQSGAEFVDAGGNVASDPGITLTYSPAPSEELVIDPRP